MSTKKATTKIAAVAAFTDEEIVAIKQSARRAWDVMAYDLFECIGKDVMKQDEVIECVLDASYMQLNGGLSSELMQKVYATSDDVLMPLMKSVFTYKRYGK